MHLTLRGQSQCRSAWWLSFITETNRIHLVLFGIQDRTFGPYWQPIIGPSSQLCARMAVVVRGDATLHARSGHSQGGPAVLSAPWGGPGFFGFWQSPHCIVGAVVSGCVCAFTASAALSGTLAFLGGLSTFLCIPTREVHSLEGIGSVCAARPNIVVSKVARV
jgi:hypothetical protein